MYVVGYAYDAAVHHPSCVVELLIRRGIAAPAARDMDVEVVLDQLADADAFDELPTAVFINDVEDAEVCDDCLQELL